MQHIFIVLALMKELFFLILAGGLALNMNAQDIETIDVDIFDFNREATRLNDQGFELLNLKKYEEAIPLFKKAIEMDTTNITYFENLGLAYKKTKAYSKMLANYQKAIQYFPFEPDLYYYCGDAYQEMEQFENAKSAYTKAIKVAGDDDTVEYLYLYYFNRGNVFLKMKDNANAMKDFNRTIELEPYFHGAFNNRGFIKFNKQDKRGACDDWKKALELGNKKVGRYIAKYCQ